VTYTLAPAPLLFDRPEITHPLDVRLGDGIRLLGYDLPADAIRPGEELLLTPYWQALEPGNRDYKVFVHLFDDAGKLWAQHDSPPAYGARPTGAWRQGQYVPDRIRLPIPADAPMGSYHLFIGMYDEETGERLPLMQDGARLQGDTLGLADVLVE
jgi:hypothetical protein